MLYDRWRQTADKFRHELALVDLPSKQSWTFGQLAHATEAATASVGQMSVPQGLGPDFIFEVLRGWKAGRVVCPIEEGQVPDPGSHLPPDCVHLKTTSASTGGARLVAFSAQQLAADAENIVATMGLRRDWPNLAVISLAHSYGFSNLVLPLLLHGIPLILVQSHLPESLRRAARLASHVTLAGVPALWRTWLESGSIPSNVRLAISAGAPLPLSLEKQVLDQCGVKIHNFYGASECGGIAYDASDVLRSEGDCVGAPLKNVQLAVRDDGCLTARSSAVGLTYWPKADPALANGSYQTTDLAEFQNGLVFIRGRQTDQINVAGRKVSPECIEQVLATHPNVRDCVVFGVSGADHRAEVIVACVATHSGDSVTELKDYLLRILPAWQVPREWWVVPEIKLNERGKLARQHWRLRYLERRSA